MNGLVDDLSVGLLVEVVHQRDGVVSVVDVAELVAGVHLDHVGGVPPVDVDLGVPLDAEDQVHAHVVVGALLVLDGHELGALVLLLDCAGFGVDLPAVDQLVLGVLVGGQDCYETVSHFQLLYVVVDLDRLRNLHSLDVEQHKFVNAEDDQYLGAEHGQLGAVLVLLVEEGHALVQAEVLQVEELQVEALQVHQVGADDVGF